MSVVSTTSSAVRRPTYSQWSRSTRLLTARLDLVLPGISTLQEDFLPIQFISQFLLTHAKSKKFDIKTSGWGKMRSRAWCKLEDRELGVGDDDDGGGGGGGDDVGDDDDVGGVGDVGDDDDVGCCCYK